MVTVTDTDTDTVTVTDMATDMATAKSPQAASAPRKRNAAPNFLGNA